MRSIVVLGVFFGPLFGCVPLGAEEDSEGLVATSKSVRHDGLQIEWEVSERWDTGACVEVSVSTLVGELSDWDVMLDLDGDIGSWLWGYGAADVEPFSARTIGVFPHDSRLFDGQVSTSSYCTEPAVLPVSVRGRSVQAVEEGDGDGGDWGAQDDPVPGGGDGETGEEDELVAGGLTSGDWGISWREAGESRGGTCLEITLMNLSDRYVDDWWAQVRLDQAATVTDAWSMGGFTFDTDVLWLVPQHYEDDAIDPRGTVTGTVCLSPYAEPVGLSVIGEGGWDSGESGGGTAPDLHGEVYDADSGWALRYHDGGTADGETCVLMMFANLSGWDATDWGGRIQLDRSTRLTRSWTVEATAARDNWLDFTVEDWAQPLDHGDVVWGGVCTEAAAAPVKLEIRAE